MPRQADRTKLQSIDSQEKDRLVEEYKSFILKTASVVLKRYVTLSDDAWSVALIAFFEALDHYDEGKGNFESYARLVITRRLIDDQRRQSKYLPEIDVAPEVFTGDAEEDDALAPLHRQVQRSVSQAGEESLAGEIADASRLLAAYGFSFMSLTDCSPKSEKTKKACAAAASYMMRTSALIAKMRHTRRLPIYAIAAGTRVPINVLSRHRRYIIAVVEILAGEYPGLSAYLDSIRKG